MSVSNRRVRCVDCYMLGYFRVEVLRGKETTYFMPETMSEECRQALLGKGEAVFGELLGQIPARDLRVACLAENTPRGERMALEPRYDDLASDNHFADIRALAVKGRECERFRQKDPHLPFDQFKALAQKRELDTTCERIEWEQRRSRLSKLGQRFKELQAFAADKHQHRGKLFELWLLDLLELYGLSPRLDVRNSYEQIDFTFKLGQLFFLGEARWRNDPVSTAQVRDFFGKLGDRPPIVPGLVVSVSGFASPALDWLSKHSGERTVITMTLPDLDAVLSGTPEFAIWLEGQVRNKLEHP